MHRQFLKRTVDYPNNGHYLQDDKEIQESNNQRADLIRHPQSLVFRGHPDRKIPPLGLVIPANLGA
jgi:hypothetical protein